MIEYLQELKYTEKESVCVIDQNKINQGTNLFDDVIIYRNAEKFKLLHQNKELLTPKDAANTLYLNLKKISKLKSGMFIDARTF